MTEKKQRGIDIIVALDDKIKEVYTDSLDISLGELANKHREKELIINPDFQRLFRWSEEKQSRFIESLLLKLPIPPFFSHEKHKKIRMGWSSTSLLKTFFDQIPSPT